MAYTRTVDQDVENQLIGIDFSNLEPGDYLLNITVKDALQDNIRTSVQKDILIQ